jgi:hypothetical protein
MSTSLTAATGLYCYVVTLLVMRVAIVRRLRARAFAAMLQAATGLRLLIVTRISVRAVAVRWLRARSVSTARIARRYAPNWPLNVSHCSVNARVYDEKQ